MASGPLKRDDYVKLPEGAGEDNVARNLLKPLYVLRAACKDWYETIRDFLANECVGWGVTSLDKSVFFLDSTRVWLWLRNGVP